MSGTGQRDQMVGKWQDSCSQCLCCYCLTRAREGPSPPSSAPLVRRSSWSRMRIPLTSLCLPALTRPKAMPPKRSAASANGKPAAGDKKATKKSKTADVTDSILDKDWYKESSSRMFVGAHVSIAGGVQNAVYEAASIGAQSFAMFLCNQKTWNVKPLDDEGAEKFRNACQELGYPSHLILPHGSYLMNPGSPDPETLSKSRALFLDGLQRCDRLGISRYNFHPGTSCGKIPVSECIDKIAESINYALANTSKVVAVIENMSKQGSTVGGDFKEIKKIIDRVKDKTRVGVCLDTCHTFAAGYDLRSDQAYEKTIQEFDTVVGLKYLKAIHLNDSKGVLNSHLDRHENIGKGQLGMKFFTRLMKDDRLKDIPMVLETPCDDNSVYKKEIALLYQTLNQK